MFFISQVKFIFKIRQGKNTLLQRGTWVHQKMKMKKIDLITLENTVFKIVVKYSEMVALFCKQHTYVAECIGNLCVSALS